VIPEIPAVLFPLASIADPSVGVSLVCVAVLAWLSGKVRLMSERSAVRTITKTRNDSLFAEEKYESGASFSDCDLYRFTLWRSWGVGGYCNFLMLNPSTADAMNNDPTVERCERRARSMGFGGLIVTNLFAFRATDPRDMKAHSDPIGERNDDAILESACQSRMIVCAWGEHGKFLNRSEAVMKLIRDKCDSKIHAIAVNNSGEPKHPLYCGYDLQPFKWSKPEDHLERLASDGV